MIGEYEVAFSTPVLRLSGTRILVMPPKKGHNISNENESIFEFKASYMILSINCLRRLVARG
jgi:hypothetical protein